MIELKTIEAMKDDSLNLLSAKEVRKMVTDDVISLLQLGLSLKGAQEIFLQYINDLSVNQIET